MGNKEAFYIQYTKIDICRRCIYPDLDVSQLISLSQEVSIFRWMDGRTSSQSGTPETVSTPANNVMRQATVES